MEAAFNTNFKNRHSPMKKGKLIGRNCSSGFKCRIKGPRSPKIEKIPSSSNFVGTIPLLKLRSCASRFFPTPGSRLLLTHWTGAELKACRRASARRLLWDECCVARELLKCRRTREPLAVAPKMMMFGPVPKGDRLLICSTRPRVFELLWVSAWMHTYEPSGHKEGLKVWKIGSSRHPLSAERVEKRENALDRRNLRE